MPAGRLARVARMIVCQKCFRCQINDVCSRAKTGDCGHGPIVVGEDSFVSTEKRGEEDDTRNE